MDKLKFSLLFWLLLLMWGSLGSSVLATESVIKWQLQSEEPSPYSEETQKTISSESSSQESEETSTKESTSISTDSSANESTNTNSSTNSSVKESTSTNESTNQAKLPQTSGVSSNKSISLWGIILIVVSCYVSFEGKRILKNEEKNS